MSSKERPNLHKFLHTWELNTKIQPKPTDIYKDATGNMSAGYGHAFIKRDPKSGKMVADNAALQKYSSLSEDEKEKQIAEWYRNDLTEATNKAMAAVGRRRWEQDLTKGERQAIVSLIYNSGDRDFKKSKALQALKRGDKDAARHEMFDRQDGFVWGYNPKTKKKERIEGLQNRREAERDDLWDAPEPNQIDQMTGAFVGFMESKLRQLGNNLSDSRRETERRIVNGESFVSQNEIERMMDVLPFGIASVGPKAFGHVGVNWAKANKNAPSTYPAQTVRGLIKANKSGMERKVAMDKVGRARKDRLYGVRDAAERHKRQVQEALERQKRGGFDYKTAQTDRAQQMLDALNGNKYRDDYLRNYKGWDFEVQQMTRDEYIRKVADGFKSDIKSQNRQIDPQRVRDYAELMRRGEKFPIPELDYRKIAGGFSQEGRHRTTAFAQAFGRKEKFPVIIMKDKIK